MSCVRHTGLLRKPKVLKQMRKCRNWQTSKTKDLVVAIPCGFKSHLPHEEEALKFRILNLRVFLL